MDLKTIAMDLKTVSAERREFKQGTNDGLRGECPPYRPWKRVSGGCRGDRGLFGSRAARNEVSRQSVFCPNPKWR